MSQPVAPPRTTDAVRLMLGPLSEYRRHLAESRAATWIDALRTPALLALMLGVLMSVAATGRVTLSLVLSQTLYWSFVPILQSITATVFVASAPARPVNLARAVELLFKGHAPWSLWLIGVAVAQTLSVDLDLLLASAVIPFAWTARILSVFAREVLGLPRGAALRRVLAHQAATVFLILLYVELATRLSVRMVGTLER